MEGFHYKNGEAFCEAVRLSTIAKKFGTPVYVYSLSFLKNRCRELKQAFETYLTLPCYSVKANSNLSILREIASQGFGADIVSVGELERCLRAKFKPETIVFSGVGKREDEISRALKVGILSFNVESLDEIHSIQVVAKKLKRIAPISFRINPNIDAKTNPSIATGLYSTKFGIAESDLEQALTQISNQRELKLVGLSCHIGSQILDVKPFEETASRMTHLGRDLIQRGFPIKFIDLGGGLGIRYHEEDPPSLEQYARTLIAEIKDTGIKLLIEPGRILVGNMGALVTQVIGVKHTPQKNFIIVDAAMNDLIRPALYDAHHDIEPVYRRETSEELKADIVGPICETGDFLATNRPFPQVSAGDLVFVKGCGAYASSMASNYNSRPRAPEVLIDGKKCTLIRERETLRDLWRLEKGAPEVKRRSPRASRRPTSQH